MEQRLEKAIDIFFMVFSGRAILVAVFFYIGCATLDLDWSKTLTICGLAYFLHVCNFGSRRMEQVGILVLAIGIASWIDLLPVKNIVAATKIQTAAALAR